MHYLTPHSFLFLRFLLSSPALSLSLSLLPSTLISFSPPKVWDVVKGEIPTFPAGLVNEMRSYN